MTSIIGSINKIEVSEWKTALIKLVLLLMVLGAVVSKLFPETKSIFETIQLPLLWLTALVTLTELITIRKAIDTKENYNYVFDALNNNIIKKFIKSEKLSLFLNGESMPILDDFHKLNGLSKANITIYLPVGVNFPDLANLPKLKNITFKVTDIDFSSSFIVLQNKDDDLDIHLLGYCEEKGAVFSRLDKNEEYAKHLGALSSIIEKNCALISKYTKHVLMYIASENHELKADAVKHKRLKLINSPFFTVSSQIASESKTSLHAVDFIPPSKWINDPLMKKYAEAHALSEAKDKRRVHVYESSDFGNKNWTVADYEIYIKIMLESGVELKFLNSKYFDKSKYEKRGTLVIDEEIAAIAINPIDGAPFGELCFLESTVDLYNKRFNDLWELSKEPECFMREINV